MFTSAAWVLLFSLLSVANGVPMSPMRRAASGSNNQNWQISETHTPSNLLNDWVYEAIDDPNDGYVNYLTQQTAMDDKLVQVSDKGRFALSADSTKTVPEGSKGRDSVRIRTPNTYGDVGDDVLIVWDVYHIPTGNGTWPALWMVGPGGIDTKEEDSDTNPSQWPNRGELDILENWGNSTRNIVTLHVNKATLKDGMLDPNSSCTFGSRDTWMPEGSWGSKVNEVQGGQYIYERLHKGTNGGGSVKVFYIPRDKVGDFKWGDNLGGDRDKLEEYLVRAYESGPDCDDLNRYFHKQLLVLNLTFCGGYGSNGYLEGNPDQEEQIRRCKEDVRYRPELYQEAYWELGNLLVYRPSSNDQQPKPTNDQPNSQPNDQPNDTQAEKPQPAETEKPQVPHREQATASKPQQGAVIAAQEKE